MKKKKFTLPFDKRIHNQRDYSKIFQRGTRLRFPEFNLIFQENDLDYSRIGISVGKKFGNAVSRNRAKRLCRELFRLNQYILPDGIDIVFLPRREILTAGWDKLSQNMVVASKKIEQKLGRRPRAK